MILFSYVFDVAGISRSPGQRIRLAWRPSNHDKVVRVIIEKRIQPFVELPIVLWVSELEHGGFLLCLGPSFRMHFDQLVFREAPIGKAEIVVTISRIEISKKAAQTKSPESTRILFDRKRNLELGAISPACREAFRESSGAGEKVYRAENLI